MKSKTNTILLAVILVILVIIAYQLIANRMEHKDSIQRSQEIKTSMEELKNSESTEEIFDCQYEGKRVYKATSYPSGGPIALYDETFTLQYENGGGFTAITTPPVYPRFDDSKVVECRSVYKQNHIQGSSTSKLNNAAATLRTHYDTWPIEQCSYQGKQVLKVDTRPVDGPVMVFNDDAVKIGEVSSGFGGNVQSTIDLNQVANCRAI